MASLRDIRKRIRSVTGSQKITRAMKLVAASKLRRAQEAVIAARPYQKELGHVLARVAQATASQNNDDAAHPLFAAREVSRTLLVAISSDKGSCGAFNSNIVRRTDRFLRENKERMGQIDVMPVGKKVKDAMSKRPGLVIKAVPPLRQPVNFSQAEHIAQALITNFVDEKYDAVILIYNEFKSAMLQQVVVRDILPVRAPPTQHVDHQDEALTPYIFAPSQDVLLAQLLPRHVAMHIFAALLESAAGEQGARMTAMEAATKNAQELADSLTLVYNRARQATITRELMDIVGGAEAISG